MRLRLPAHGWIPRPYQLPLWRYLEAGGKNAVAVWHRRAGKDEVALHWTAIACHQRAGNYWHMLPEYAQARKAVWDAINPHTGRRRIDEVFPEELRKATNSHEMKIEFKHTNSIWQVVGSDNFNSLIGSPPVGIVYSEWAVADPRAHAFLRPILAENGGWSLFIYTSRGYNHGFTTYETAKGNPESFCERLTAEDTPVFSAEALEKERIAYRAEYGFYEGDALFRQEYFCDFSASVLGSVVGRHIEDADKDGRICDFEHDGAPVVISSDIGRHDASAWWFWVPRAGGFDLIDYDEDTGMDADDWADRLKALATRKGYEIERIWLPHDARVKTFQSKYSSLERFLAEFGNKVSIVPMTKIADRINAGRRVTPRCRFHLTNCKRGLDGLRAWAFGYDYETKENTKDPLHTWASHPGDAFSYGCQVMEERVAKIEDKEEERAIVVGASTVTLEDMWKDAARGRRMERI